MGALRTSLRVFTSRPVLATAIVLTLAIGLGSVTAIFSITYALLLRPLPFPDADRIVSIHAEVAGEQGASPSRSSASSSVPPRSS